MKVDRRRSRSAPRRRSRGHRLARLVPHRQGPRSWRIEALIAARGRYAHGRAAQPGSSVAAGRRDRCRRSSSDRAAAAATDFGVPSQRSPTPDRRRVTAAGARAPRRPRRGGLGRSSTASRSGAGGAPQGSARRRSRPRQDGSATSSRPTHAYAREHGHQAPGAVPTSDRAARRGRSRRGRSRSCASRRMARRSPDASGRPATRPAGSPGTPSTTPGRWKTAPNLRLTASIELTSPPRPRPVAIGRDRRRAVRTSGPRPRRGAAVGLAARCSRPAQLRRIPVPRIASSRHRSASARRVSGEVARMPSSAGVTELAGRATPEPGRRRRGHDESTRTPDVWSSTPPTATPDDPAPRRRVADRRSPPRRPQSRDGADAGHQRSTPAPARRADGAHPARFRADRRAARARPATRARGPIASPTPRRRPRPRPTP